MDIGSLFLSLGIKGDTKSLDDTIKKVEELKKQTQELNKALKETKANSKINISTSGAASPKTSSQYKNPELLELKEKASFANENLKLARAEMGLEKLKNSEQEKQQKKQEKEQKKLEREREKATKDFFRQVDNGFSFIAKAFTGGLLAGGIGGYVTSQAAKQVNLANSLKQYGIDPEKSQRFANVFRQASNGQVGLEETNAFIANLSEQIAKGWTTNPEILSQFGILGIDPTKVKDFESAFREIRQYSKSPDYKPSNLTSLLGQLGVPKEFTPAFGNEFSDKQFNDAYDNARILSNKQVQSGADVNLRIAQLDNQWAVFKGALLDKFAPAIERFIDYVESKLSPENVDKVVKEAENIASKAKVTAGGAVIGGLVGGPIGAIVGGSIAYSQKDLLDKHGVKKIVVNGKSRIVSKEEFEAFKNRKSSNSADYTADFGNQSPDSVTDSLYRKDPNDRLSLRDIESAIKQTTINPTSNVNITTNINAASVDKDTAPFIVNGINGNVNSALNRNQLYNSKYPTLSTPN